MTAPPSCARGSDSAGPQSKLIDRLTVRPAHSLLSRRLRWGKQLPVSETSSKVIYQALKSVDVRVVSALPETWLVHLIRMAEDDPDMSLVRLAKEEEGIGVSTGAHLAGVRSALLMQNHGFLQSINGIVSCALLYKIPLLKGKLRHHDGDGCTFPGCGRRSVDGHHIWPWEWGGPTDLDNLVLVCKFHHSSFTSTAGESRFGQATWGSPLVQTRQPALPTKPGRAGRGLSLHIRIQARGTRLLATAPVTADEGVG